MKAFKTTSKTPLYFLGLISGVILGVLIVLILKSLLPSLARPWYPVIVFLCMFISMIILPGLIERISSKGEDGLPENMEGDENFWAWLVPQGMGLKSGFPINKDIMTIGRDVSCDILLNNDLVSRKHAELTRITDGYLLRDLGSTNGIFINGQRVQEKFLNPGDMITIGELQFLFQMPGARKPVITEPIIGQERPQESHLSSDKLDETQTMPPRDASSEGN